MKFLVTGAFGYLGGRLARGLANEGHEVVLTGRHLPRWRGVLADAGRHAILDVLEPESAGDLFDAVDVVVHLAALDENEAVRDPAKALLVSGEGTRRLLDVALARGVGQAVFLSTFHVYGPGAPEPLLESAPIRPVHPYAIAHAAGEGYVFAANHKARRPFARVIRFSNGYGAPAHVDVDRWTLAHNDFCRGAALTGRVVLKSSGLQHRDFVWIEDLVQATEIIGGAPDDAMVDPVFHIGGGTSASIRSVAATVIRRAEERFGRKVVMDAPEPGPGDVEKPVLFDIGRARALGFAPRNRLDEETDRLLELAGMLSA